MRRFLNIGGVLLGALALTTLGISASDSIQGASGSLVSMLMSSSNKSLKGCETGSGLVVVQGRKLCVDIFEASTGPDCPVQNPKNLLESERDVSVAACRTISAEDTEPWRYISLSQAQRACAQSGKRLLTNEEWYRAALGTPADATSCFIAGQNAAAPRVAQQSSCRSGSGMYDMVGNVWEWVDSSVLDGRYNDRKLPETGYVTGVDSDGVALSTDEHDDELYGKDYFWQSDVGVRGMLRGGFYSSGNDGGLYALNASVEPGFGSAGVGFRCVRDYSE